MVFGVTEVCMRRLKKTSGQARGVEERNRYVEQKVEKNDSINFLIYVLF
jgi:hypothetical protein